MVGYSNGTIPFNHGQLCQMLRSASDNELANVINDVSKEQERRETTKKNECLNNIRKAISEAVKAGYSVNFYFNSDSEDPAFTVHSNNEFLYDIELFTDD